MVTQQGLWVIPPLLIVALSFTIGTPDYKIYKSLINCETRHRC